MFTLYSWHLRVTMSYEVGGNVSQCHQCVNTCVPYVKTPACDREMTPREDNLKRKMSYDKTTNKNYVVRKKVKIK